MIECELSLDKLRKHQLTKQEQSERNRERIKTEKEKLYTKNIRIPEYTKYLFIFTTNKYTEKETTGLKTAQLKRYVSRK